MKDLSKNFNRRNIDYTGQRRGRLLIKGPVSPADNKYKSNAKEWYCACDCGTELQLQTRMISGSGKYTQKSCGCLRAPMHLAATTKIENLTFDYIDSFSDFEKYQFLHKAYVKSHLKINCEKKYKEFIEFFYEDPQFNAVYKSWKQKKESHNTFYDWYKPSIDHKLPVSRGGNGEVNNLQFLTVFENLAKRDMTEKEWNNFKLNSNTKSDLFIRREG